MKNVISILTFLTIISVNSISYAQEITLPVIPTPANEIDVGAAISPMKKGDKAIFTGLLLSPKAIATLMTQMNFEKEQIKIETNKVKGEEYARCEFKLAEQKTTCDADKRILQGQIDTQKKDIEVLTTRLKDETSNNKNFNLWVGAGFVGGVVTTIATVFAIAQIVK